MLNYIWAIMIVVGILYGAATGNISAVSNGMLNSAREAITLCITMLGVMSMWTGLMEIAKQSGIINQMSKLIRPFVNFLFPNIPENHESREHITTNIIANILGLGLAATPAGLKAMKSLSHLEEEREKENDKKTRRWGKGVASTEMCTFLVINISSLQLIPVNIIAYRSQYGSVNPACITMPAIIATLCSTITGIIYAKWKQKQEKVK